MIPKVLHFVWIGDESKCPHGCIDSWRKLNPDYEVRVWGNDDYENGDWLFREQMARIYETGQIYGVVDLMRWEILHRHGGITLDADSLCLAPLPEWLLQCTAFACWQNELSHPGLISNGHVGTAPGDPLIGHLIDKLRAQKDLAWRRKYFGLKKKKRVSWKTTGPGLLTEAFHELSYQDLTVLPSHFFIPHNKSGDNYTGHGPVIAVQLYGSTRTSRMCYEQLADMSPEDILRHLNEEQHD